MLRKSLFILVSFLAGISLVANIHLFNLNKSSGTDENLALSFHLFGAIKSINTTLAQKSLVVDIAQRDGLFISGDVLVTVNEETKIFFRLTFLENNSIYAVQDEQRNFENLTTGTPIRVSFVADPKARQLIATQIVYGEIGLGSSSSQQEL